METHIQNLQRAIMLGNKSPATQRYKVGCVITSQDGALISDGYTEEISAICHAEEAAITKAIQNGTSLKGSIVYSSMEPCSSRASAEKTCTQLLIDAGVSTVVYAYQEPVHLAICEGHALLEQAGIEVIHIDALSAMVITANPHIIGA